MTIDERPTSFFVFVFVFLGAGKPAIHIVFVVFLIVECRSGMHSGWDWGMVGGCLVRKKKKKKARGGKENIGIFQSIELRATKHTHVAGLQE